jgi:hypothetical protein
MNPAELGGILSSTEPLSTVDFSKAKFTLEPGWAVGIEDALGTDIVAASVKAGAGEFSLTKDALLQATSLIGLTQNYVLKTPSNLVQPHLNYWYGDGMTKECKLLTQDLTAIAVTKANIYPFSNFKFLEILMAQLDDSQVFDAVEHSPKLTTFRLFSPDVATWNFGVQLVNSQVGYKPTQLRGFMATDDGLGLISSHSTSGNWNRRTGGQGDEVYEWAEEAAQEIITNSGHELDVIEELSKTELNGDVAETFIDLFSTYAVPLESRSQILAEFANQQDMTMYGVMLAVSIVAKHTPKFALATKLMEVAGDLPRANSARCEKCHRIPVL